MCLKCGELYIGETGRMLSERFWEHLRDIKKNKSGKEVAKHFNSNGHVLEDVSVAGLVFKNELSERRSLESSFIRSLGTLSPHGMNLEEDHPY